MGLLDGIINKGSQAIDTGQQAHSVLEELILNANRPRFNTPGIDLRLMRGGFGDAFLNTDQPDPRLVQSQMGQVQKAAFPDNARVLGALLARPIQSNLIRQTSRIPAQNLVQGRDLIGRFTKGFINK